MTKRVAKVRAKVEASPKLRNSLTIFFNVLPTHSAKHGSILVQCYWLVKFSINFLKTNEDLFSIFSNNQILASKT